MFQSIQKLIQQTAKDLNQDPVLTEKVIMSQFLFVKNQIANPYYACIRLEDFGKYEVAPSAVRAFFKLARARLLAKPDSPPFLKAVKDIASMRYPSQKYYLSRKYKKRFGSWHYKAITKQ